MLRNLILTLFIEIQMDLVTSFNTLSKIQGQAVVLWNISTEYSIASLQNIFDNLCTFKTRGKIGTLNYYLNFYYI